MTTTQQPLSAPAAQLVSRLWAASCRATSPAQLARLDRMIGAVLDMLA